MTVCLVKRANSNRSLTSPSSKTLLIPLWIRSIGGTKDETADILQYLILSLEYLCKLKVRRIRSDNGTEFKDNLMELFCLKKGIRHEFSTPYTPQQNGVAERKNRTLIET
ncbi:hypothetical protein L1987_53011 [Smallanthus sonchifolius]|uniref:Uncharacterized protein n=1 Tax=Smallanthus sonchifolius TaxID=185202 RepID=A0ACB9EUP9_9ASTR|nr:hypothetical protein L1987_53011 [Smallanthus sonchifolius]